MLSQFWGGEWSHTLNLYMLYNPELLHWIQGNTSMLLKRSCTRVMYPMLQHELINLTTIFRLPMPVKRASAWRTTWTQRARTTHSTNHILEYIINVCEWDPNTFPLMAIWTPALGRKIQATLLNTLWHSAHAVITLGTPGNPTALQISLLLYNLNLLHRRMPKC